MRPPAFPAELTSTWAAESNAEFVREDLIAECCAINATDRLDHIVVGQRSTTCAKNVGNVKILTVSQNPNPARKGLSIHQCPSFRARPVHYGPVPGSACLPGPSFRARPVHHGPSRVQGVRLGRQAPQESDGHGENPESAKGHGGQAELGRKARVDWQSPAQGHGGQAEPGRKGNGGQAEPGTHHGCMQEQHYADELSVKSWNRKITTRVVFRSKFRHRAAKNLMKQVQWQGEGMTV